MSYRVVGWSTGGVGRLAIRAIARRPDLELVGVWVHSAEKDGVDAGTLAGIEPLGLAATSDPDALLALAPDCVCYSASGEALDAAAVPDLVRMLEAGINVVTVSTPGLVHPAGYQPDWRAQLGPAAPAARRGGRHRGGHRRRGAVREHRCRRRARRDRHRTRQPDGGRSRARMAERGARRHLSDHGGRQPRPDLRAHRRPARDRE